LLEGGATVVYGESNAGKTFWALDLALHVAAGLLYCGRRVEAGGVVYCCLEGSSRFRNRVCAFRCERGLDGQDIPFIACEASINLLDPKADTDRLIKLIEDTKPEIDVPLKLIVVDTLSRALAGGNENSPEDMGALVMNMDRIRHETGAAVLFVHHSGKDQAKGARGHSLLRAAIDTEIEVINANGSRTATVVKQRELATGDVLSFQLKTIELGRNRYDEPVTTCIVVPSDAPAAAPAPTAAPARTKLTGNMAISARALRTALESHGQNLPKTTGYPPNVRAVFEDEWRAAFYATFPDAKADTKRTKYNRAKTDLIGQDVITALHERVWFTKRADE
jgi:hypothetical protein